MWDKGWDKIFSENDWGHYPAEPLIRFIARNFYSVPDRSKIQILELGCGPGANLWYLAREGFGAHGIDGSQIALHKAAERLSAEEVYARLHLGDAISIPYLAEYFDCVIDIECLYSNNQSDTARIIAEVVRVLKPCGLLFSMTFESETLLKSPTAGVNRLMNEADIPRLYSGFSSIEYDLIMRSDNNRRNQINEWIITCRK